MARLLAVGVTVAEASRQTGVAESTIWGWQRSTQWEEIHMRAARIALSGERGEAILQSQMRIEASLALQKIVKNTAQPRTAIKAAQIVLRETREWPTETVRRRVHEHLWETHEELRRRVSGLEGEIGRHLTRHLPAEVSRTVASEVYGLIRAALAEGLDQPDEAEDADDRRTLRVEVAIDGRARSARLTGICVFVSWARINPR